MEISEDKKTSRKVYYRCFNRIEEGIVAEGRPAYAGIANADLWETDITNRRKVFDSEKYVTEALIKLGLMCNKKSVLCLKYSILRTLEIMEKEDRNIVFSYDVYNYVSKKMGMSARNIQQNVRNAVSFVLEYDGGKILDSFFGHNLTNLKSKVRSIDFIREISRKTLTAKQFYESL